MTDAVQTSTHDSTPPAESPPDPKRWWALAVLAASQLMIVLDASIVNIALPSAQDELGISNADRQWVVTAYTLAFGALLLLGGRIADYTGRKRTFIIGLIGFAVASAILPWSATSRELPARSCRPSTFCVMTAVHTPRTSRPASAA